MESPKQIQRKIALSLSLETQSVVICFLVFECQK